METGVLSQVVLPLAIALIMVAMGMSLVVDDFRRLLSEPRAVLTGLGCQLLLLPALGFAVAAVFPLEPLYAVSVVLLTASPGGTTSNLVVHVADVDRALSVTLTAISNVAVFVLMPFELELAQSLFGGPGEQASIPVVQTMVQVAGLTVVPVLIGMGIRTRWQAFADRTQDLGKVLSGVVLGLVIVGLTIQNWDQVVSEGPTFAPAFITLNALALATGFLVARAVGLDRTQAVTIGVETGLQNATVAIAIALSILDSAEMAIVPGLYGVWMLVTGFAFALWLRPAPADDTAGAAVTS